MAVITYLNGLIYLTLEKQWGVEAQDAYVKECLPERDVLTVNEDLA